MGRGERRGDPAIDDGAGIRGVRLLGAEQIARGMARTAMAQSKREISSAVPFLPFARHRLKPPGPEEENLPPFLEGTDIEREWNRVRRRARPDRRPRHQIRIDRPHILIRDFGKMIKWECGEKVRAVLRD